LYRLTGGDRALAEDLVQETMVRLRGMGSYDGQRPFKPWLCQTGVNVARDYYKQAEMRHTTSAKGEISLINTPERSETAVIQQQTIQAAVTAVAHLPPHHHICVL
jgi:RNA polymerase sigma factor (sigma-70 family)